MMATADAVYEGWRRTQNRLLQRVPEMSRDHLALRGSADGWPIWAIVSHIAVARVYWLCTVCGEPGLETTPFTEPAADGWEDHLDQPRGAGELVEALETSWVIVESCLARWTHEDLGVSFMRVRNGQTQHHSRYSVLTRLMMHDAFHAGEISMLLGEEGLASLDPWEVQLGAP